MAKHKDGKRKFRKSSFSPNQRGLPRCVGVSITAENVQVINIRSKGRVLEFTTEEWEVFIKGVKNGEFDIV